MKKIQYTFNSEDGKYQPYHRAKIIKTNVLQVKKQYLLIKNK